MPRLNAHGDIAAGVGGESVVVNGRSVAVNAGGAVWLDDNHVIYQCGSHLETYDVRNSLYDIDLDPQGANELAAGGGVYAAKVNGTVRTSRGETFPGAGVADVGPDGSVLLYGANGLLNGTIPVRDVQALGGGLWSGLVAYRPIQSAGVPHANVVDGNIYGFRRAGSFCCYLAEQGARFIVQHLDRPVGKVVAITPNAFRPDLVLLPNGNLRVVYAETEGEAWASVKSYDVAVSELTQRLDAPAPVVVVPPPAPKPVEPKPVSQFLSPNVIEILKRYVAKFPVPRAVVPEDFVRPGAASEVFENKARAWVKGLAEQVRFETGDAAYGVKNAGGGRPQSKDSLAENRERLINFDLLSGVGTGRPTLIAAPQGADITGQQFMPVQPVDHLGTATQPPVPPPVVTPPVSDDLAALRNEVAALSVKLALLEGRVDKDGFYIDALDNGVVSTQKRLDALEQKPAPTYKATGSTSRDFGHSHRINVTLEPQA